MRSRQQVLLAARCLIDDAHYSDVLENFEVLHSHSVRRAIANSLGGDDLTYGAANMLWEMVNIQDDCPVEAWPKALDKIVVPDAPALKGGA